jgi:hypothetical protein
MHWGSELFVMQVLLLDELTTFLDEEDQRGVLEAVRTCAGGPDQARHFALASTPFVEVDMWLAGDPFHVQE